MARRKLFYIAFVLTTIFHFIAYTKSESAANHDRDYDYKANTAAELSVEVQLNMYGKRYKDKGTSDPHKGKSPIYKYLGCYDSWNGNNQTGTVTLFEGCNTPEKCVRQCMRQSRQYQLGFLKENICHCSEASYFHLVRVPDAYCDVTCAANTDKKSGDSEDPETESLCGGNYVFSVYCSETGDLNCSSLIKPFHPLDIYRSTQRPPLNESDLQNDSGVNQLEIRRNDTVIPYLRCANCTSVSCRRRAYSPEYDYLPNNSPTSCIAHCGRPVLYLREDEVKIRNATKYAILLWDKYMVPPFIPPSPVCACRNDISSFERLEVDSKFCNTPCPGDRNQNCGGNGYVTVHYVHPRD